MLNLAYNECKTGYNSPQFCLLSLEVFEPNVCCNYYKDITNNTFWHVRAQSYLDLRNQTVYRLVASRSTSRLVTCLGLFRLLMKGIFGPYVLWPLDRKLIFWIVTPVSARDSTVNEIHTASFESKNEHITMCSNSCSIPNAGSRNNDPSIGGKFKHFRNIVTQFLSKKFIWELILVEIG